MAVVTITRQLGSEGDRIAEELARATGYDYVDRWLIEEVARLTDAAPAEVEAFDEKGEGRIEFFLKCLLVPEFAGRRGGRGPAVYAPVSSAVYFPGFGLEFPYALEREAPQTAPRLDRGTYQLLITTLVQDLGQTGRAVIVGRASQVILAALPGAVHVKVVAPLEVRCQRLAQRLAVGVDDARNLVEQHDGWRQAYLRNYYQQDWDDPLLYDLTVNTGRVSSADAIELILRCVERRDRQEAIPA
jgi:cytidylate kinase